jgi:DNA-binding transcriptional LysR family regulator
MVAVKIGTIRQIICASPGYLSEQGRPLSPDDLVHHQRISYSWSGEVSDWPFKTASGKTRRFPVQARSSFNSVEAIVDWAVQDGGVALMYAYQAAHHIADGALEIILSDYEVDPLPVFFIYPQGGHLPRKVRAFIDYAMAHLPQRLADIEAQCST